MADLKSQLQKMTPKEREAVLKVIGDKKLLDELYDQDYWEKPITIDEFLENPDYLGWATENGKAIYPYWRERMREIFDESKDYSEVALTGCLSGDTLIPLLNGKKVRMDELSSIGDLDEYVYSFDVNKNEYVPGHLVKAFSTGIKRVYRIYLDNGKYIDATSNHKFMTRDKRWKSIDTGLSENDSLMPFNTDNVGIIKIEYLYEQEVYDLTVEKYHNFATECGIVAHNSIGCGKSHIAVLCLCYCLYRMMCLRDPASYYGLSKGSPIYIVFLNLTIQLSQGVAFSKFNNILLGSPWFMRHGKSSNSLKSPEYVPDGNIRFTAGSSVSHVIGKDIACLSGDTKLVYEGGVCPIGLLDGQMVRVYTMNDDGSVALTEEPVFVQKTKEVKDLIEIELEDNTIIRCTEDHKFLTKKKEYKEAKDLTEYDELNLIKIKRITRIQLDNPQPVYDVINVPHNHNFLIQTNTSFVVSHNCALLDELNFGRGASTVSIEKNQIMGLYNNVAERVRSRFIVDGRCKGKVFLVSSKKAESDFLESYIKKQKDNPNVKVCDAILWKIKPQGTYSGKKFKVAFAGINMPPKIIREEKGEKEEDYIKMGYNIEEVPIEFKSSFELDILSALNNVCGIVISDVSKFITYESVAKCYNQNIKNPFEPDVVVMGCKDKQQLRDYYHPERIPEELYSLPIFIHLDCSINGDKTGISGVAVLGYKYENKYDIVSNTSVPTKELMYRHIFTVGIQAPSGDEISFQKSREFLYYLKNELGYNIKGVSTDGFQSYELRQNLVTMGFQDVSLVSLDRKPDGYLCLRSALNEKRIMLPPDMPLLESELINLQRDNQNGKIDHPVDSSKDLSDSLAGAVFNASEHSSIFTFAVSEMFGEAVSENIETSNSEQDKEMLLSSLITPLNSVMNRPGDTKEAQKKSRDAYNDYSDLMDDMLIF